MTTLSRAKQRNIHIRISEEAKDLIERAVVASGQSLTDFATRSLLDSASSLLEREYLSTLSNRDRDLLMKLLDEDKTPDKGLREAAAIHKKLIIE